MQLLNNLIRFLRSLWKKEISDIQRIITTLKEALPSQSKKHPFIAAISRQGLLFIFLLYLAYKVGFPSSIANILRYPDARWLQFWGALVGGAMVLIGVRWTIQHNNNLENENLRIKILPMIAMINVENSAETKYYANTKKPLKNDSDLKNAITVDDSTEFDRMGYRYPIRQTNQNSMKYKLFVTVENKGRGDAFITDRQLYVGDIQLERALWTSLAYERYLPINEPYTFLLVIHHDSFLSLSELKLRFVYSDDKSNIYHQDFEIINICFNRYAYVHDRVKHNPPKLRSDSNE